MRFVHSRGVITERFLQGSEFPWIVKGLWLLRIIVREACELDDRAKISLLMQVTQAKVLRQ